MQSGVQKEALDRRLCVRQSAASDGADVLSVVPGSQGHRGRKIAPTKVDHTSVGGGFPRSVPVGADSAVGSTAALITPVAELAAEASARDLCTHIPEGGAYQVEADNRKATLNVLMALELFAGLKKDADVSHAPQDLQQGLTPLPSSAWTQPLTPSSAGSTSTQCRPNPKGHQLSQAAAASGLTTQSAPATVTPAKPRGKGKRISPSPLGEAAPYGQPYAASSQQGSAWHGPKMKPSAPAWSKRPADQLAPSDAATPARQPSPGPLSQKQVSAASAMQQNCYDVADTSAWGRSGGNTRSPSPALHLTGLPGLALAHTHFKAGCSTDHPKACQAHRLSALQVAQLHPSSNQCGRAGMKPPHLHHSPGQSVTAQTQSMQHLPPLCDPGKTWQQRRPHHPRMPQ